MTALRCAALTAVLLLAGGGTALAEGCPTRHTVSPGDTLSRIAQRYYGDRLRFRELYAANRGVIGADPSIIEIGTVLAIPCLDGSTAAPPPDAAPETVTAPEGWLPLMDLAGLDAAAPAAQVLDIRPLADTTGGFIPGALVVPFSRWRSELAPGGAGLPPERALSRLIGEAGIDINRPVVLVPTRRDAASMGEAAWIYWVLKSAGARQIAILEPGFEGWRDAGRPVVQSPASARARQVALTLADDWTAGADDVAKIAAGDIDGAIVTGHPEVFFLDQSTTGATASGRAAEILEILKGVPVDWERRTVVFVSPDVLSGAAAWFYASEVAGIRNVRLHPEPRAN